MKVDLINIGEGFVVRPVEIAKETCYLVFPQHIGVKWTKNNLILRSSVWSSTGEPVSLSFKKFFNWGEQPDLHYTPFSLKANGGVRVMEKIDGSTMIVSKYKNELIVRTRGTVDAEIMENGQEVSFFKEKYSKAFDNSLLDSGCSLIYEWVSPLNRSVLKYSEPDIYLIGCIYHKDYSLMMQSELDSVAKQLGVKRPRCYTFDSIKEMQATVEAFKGVEGVCVYCDYDQEILKLKGVEYLAKHRMKEELGSFERVVDFYFTQNMPSFKDFMKAIEDTVDFETAQEVIGDASRIVDGMKEVNKIIEGMKSFIAKFSDLTRKQIAAEILNAYGNTNRCGMVFTLLDKKELTTDHLKKMLYQVLKK